MSETKEIVTVPEPNSLMNVIARAATDPAVDIDKMERLLQMQERVMDREATQSYNRSMINLQATLRTVVADSSNPQTRSKYASYNGVDKAVRPSYTSHGFAPTFGTEESPKENHVRVTCLVRHDGGHTDYSFVDMPCDGKGAKGGDVMTKTHAVASALSYGKRYLLILAFNIPIGDDDDGNDAGNPVEFITDDQAKQIEDILEEIGGFDPFRTYYKIASVDCLPASKFADALAQLEKRKAALAAMS